MFYKLAEKGMEVREGEKPFSTRLSNAFFGNLGYRPFRGGQHINGAGHLLEAETGCVRIVLNVTTTYGDGKSVNQSFATAHAEDMADAERLVENMNDPAALARANRAIEAVPAVIANAGNIVPYAGAAGALILAALS